MEHEVQNLDRMLGKCCTDQLTSVFYILAFYFHNLKVTCFFLPEIFTEKGYTRISHQIYVVVQNDLVFIVIYPYAINPFSLIHVMLLCTFE